MNREQSERIKTVMLGHARQQSRKVAKLMEKTIETLEAETIEFEKSLLDKCLLELISSGQLVAAGNILNWRHSEVRWPDDI
jgi:hypothetical protein